MYYEGNFLKYSFNLKIIAIHWHRQQTPNPEAQVPDALPPAEKWEYNIARLHSFFGCYFANSTSDCFEKYSEENVQNHYIQLVKRCLSLCIIIIIIIVIIIILIIKILIIQNPAIMSW